ncbi:MAG: hypothetical protein DME08_02160 [Candidatus Rokuibacteriota bacterium]|nr:MAG: hypothetical protein DME08_02160 [Candidatus Rokubacteria bacterium]
MAMAIRRPTKPAMLNARSPAIATVGATTATRMLMAGHSTALCWLDGPGVFEADARAHHLRRRLRGPRPRPAATLPRRPHGGGHRRRHRDGRGRRARLERRGGRRGRAHARAALRHDDRGGLPPALRLIRAGDHVGHAPRQHARRRARRGGRRGRHALRALRERRDLRGDGAARRRSHVREAPVALVGLGCVFVVVWLVYRRQLPPALGAAAVEPPVTVHYPLMIKTVVAVLVMLAAFLGGVPIAIVAIAGAAATLLTRRVNPNKVYREIDWKLLVLFTGLFVLTGGAERTGLADAITTSPLAAGLERPAVLTAVTAVLSNLVSNVPAVLMFKPIVPQLAEPTRAWLLVAMASTLSGNLTILGSVANLIVVEAARSSGVRIGFAEYCRVGVPLTLVTLLLGALILAVAP